VIKRRLFWAVYLIAILAFYSSLAFGGAGDWPNDEFHNHTQGGCTSATDCGDVTVAWANANGSEIHKPYCLTSNPQIVDSGSSWEAVTKYSRECESESAVGTGTGAVFVIYEWYDSDIPAECGGGATAPDCPEECDGTITGKTFLRPVFSGGHTGDICHESSGCVMSAGSTSGLSGGDLVEYAGTASGCSSEPNVANVPDSAEDANCISSAGDVWCTEPDLADQNCGYLNDDYLCLDSIPEGECTFFGNGKVACESTAATPPTPDDGVTPGTPATPDAVVNSDSATTNIFNSSSVTNSTEPTAAGQQSDGPEAPDDEQGTGSASSSCDVPPSCSGDAIQCAILQQEWESSCQDVGTEGEILADTGLDGYAVGDLDSEVNLTTSLDGSGFLGAGECSIDIPMDLGYFGAHTIPLSQWCPFFLFIGTLVLISGGLTSLKILAGAF